MTKYGLLGAAAMLAIAAPALAMAQSVTVEAVPPARVTVPVQTGPSAPANQTYLLVPVAPQPPEMRPLAPTPTSEWVPAGWAWDSALGQYRWISGHYIEAMAGEPPLEYPATWVPGHYAGEEDRLVWVAGHWE